MDIDLKPLYRGKVRDIYAINDKKILIIASDRISAFDVVLKQNIKDKGKVLTTISNFWFDKTKKIIDNHLVDDDLFDLLGITLAQKLKDRSVIVKKLTPLPIEAIVRGYIVGSGWSSYKQNGGICGIKLPPKLQLAQQLATPIYTPSTKANIGEHDKNITYKQSVAVVGSDLAQQVRDKSLELYTFASKYALKKGIIIADTKFEFGLDENNKLILMDEAITPDSSRFWSVKNYKKGVEPESFDKQIVRNYLNEIGWNKRDVPPVLPLEIIDKTINRYQKIERILLDL